MGNRVVFVAGGANTGKSTSLRNLKNRNKYAYLNADDKALPIGGAKAFLTNQRIVNPADALAFYQQLEATDKCEGVILDTLTYLMSAYERKVVDVSDEGFGAWKDYNHFYKNINDTLKSSNKTHIVMGHTETALNPQSMSMEAKILVKGAAGKIGIESDHTIVVTSKQMPINKLKEYPNALLNITPQEELLGIKYVFAVQLTKEFLGDCTRAPMDFWQPDEIYIDNDIQIVLDRLDAFYGTEQ